TLEQMDSRFRGNDEIGASRERRDWGLTGTTRLGPHGNDEIGAFAGNDDSCATARTANWTTRAPCTLAIPARLAGSATPRSFHPAVRSRERPTSGRVRWRR